MKTNSEYLVWVEMEKGIFIWSALPFYDDASRISMQDVFGRRPRNCNKRFMEPLHIKASSERDAFEKYLLHPAFVGQNNLELIKLNAKQMINNYGLDDCLNRLNNMQTQMLRRKPLSLHVLFFDPFIALFNYLKPRKIKNKIPPPEPCCEVNPSLKDEILMRLEFLRCCEGDTVTLISDNTDFNDQPNCKIRCSGNWTGWEDMEFCGGTLLECLEKARQNKLANPERPFTPLETQYLVQNRWTTHEGSKAFNPIRPVGDGWKLISCAVAQGNCVIYWWERIISKGTPLPKNQFHS